MTDDLTRQLVLMRLGRGRDNARTIGDLAESLHLLRRSVEQAVQELRREGWPIASDGGGVWIGDRADLDRCIASLQGRLVAQRATLRSLRRARERMLPVEQLGMGLDSGEAA